MAKVIVGMSGGVDSAVAAYLLKKQGYEVIGVTLRTWTSQEGEESRCCEIDDARRIADRIGIGYRTLNCEQAFRQSVIEPFVQEYVSGKTPNPCVICNRRVKWEWMTYLAGVLQADYVATGHYASIVQLENGRYTVKRASSKKDQAYMLYRLSQEQLSRTLLPLSDLTKDEVRAIAEEAQLPVIEDTADSICAVICVPSSLMAEVMALCSCEPMSDARPLMVCEIISCICCCSRSVLTALAMVSVISCCPSCVFRYAVKEEPIFVRSGFPLACA